MRIYIDRLLAVLLVLGLWNFLSLSYGSDAVAAPMATWQRLVMLISTGFIGPHLNFTLSSWIVSVLLAGVVGLSIGLLLGLHRASGLVFEPLIIAVSSLPKVTLYPMVLLICGLGQSSKIAFGFIHGVLPIMLFTLGAARNYIALRENRSHAGLESCCHAEARHVTCYGIRHRIGYALRCVARLVRRNHR